MQKILPIEGKKDAKGQKMRRLGAESSAHRRQKDAKGQKMGRFGAESSAHRRQKDAKRAEDGVV